MSYLGQQPAVSTGEQSLQIPNRSIGPEKLTVGTLNWTSDGNVGIGTTTPTAIGGFTALMVNAAGAGNPLVDLAKSNTVYGRLSVDTTGLNVESAKITFFTGAGGVGTGVERLRIDSSGNVGIGTNSPDKKLTVAGEIKTTVGIRFPDGSLQTQAATAPAAGSITPDRLSTGGPYWATNGNLGIGSSAPGRKLDVEGDGRFVQVQAATTGAITLRQNSGDTVGAHIQWVNNANTVEKGWLVVDTSSNMLFATQSTERMRIDNNGNIGVGITAPSAKLHVDGQVRAGPGSASTPAFGVGDNNSGFYRISAGDTSIGVSVGGVERFRFTDTAIRFPDGSLQTTAGSPSIGVGQSWQTITANRALNTTYTNTTGKAIQILVTFSPVNDTPVRLIVNSTEVARWQMAGYTLFTNFAAVIPNNTNYSVSTTNASLFMWAELR